MARNGIQYSDVQQAIDVLLTRGDNPSVQRIRDVLGTGSFTTISEHFRLWRSEREQNRDVPPPKGVPEAVVTAASQLWKEAQEAANQALVHYREEANRQVEAAQQAEQEASRQAADAEQRESALAEHLRHVEQRMEALNRELATSQANEHHWQQLAQDARDEAVQLKQAHQQWVVQAEENAHARATELDQQRLAAEQRLGQEEQRHEAAEGRLMAMLDAAQQTRAQEEKAYQKRLAQSQQRIETLSQELNLKQQALHQMQLESGEQEQQLSANDQRIAALTKQQQSLMEQLNQAQSALKQQAQQQVEKEALLQQEWQEKLWSRMEALQQQLTELPASLADKAPPSASPES
ncbi:DNA-binding protein [Vreelandella profundi]|uniref:DNA-binding protein n=1 Tax=Vreelandella profundi TaxID=2852117 RepID=UPI001EF09CEC|nr:DNA-binding protein [Halomonas profundi]